MDNTTNRTRHLDDSDRNILRSLAHEACEGHCPECEACIPWDADPTLCEECGWDADADAEEEHDWTRCDCRDCRDEQDLQRGKQSDPERWATL